MPIAVTCPKCGKTGHAPDEAIGRNCRCKVCKTVFMVEAPKEAPTPANGPASQLDPCIRQIDAYEYRVTSVAISPDGQHGLSCGEDWRDASLRLWHLGTGECLKTLVLPEKAHAFAISRDMRWVVAATYHKMFLWDITAGKCVQTMPWAESGELTSVGIDGNGRWMIAGNNDSRQGKDYVLCLFDLANGKLVKKLHGHTGSAKSLSISTDGQQALSQSFDELRLWNLAKGQCIRAFPQGGGGNECSVVLSPDGRRGLSAGHWQLYYWDLGNGKCIREMACKPPDTNGKDAPYSVALSSDGRYALSGHYTGCVRLYNLDTGECIRLFEGHKKPVNSVGISADGRLGLSGGNDGKVFLWRLPLALDATRPPTHAAASAPSRPSLPQVSESLLANVPNGRFAPNLAHRNEHVYITAVREITALAESGDRSGLNELEALIRANCPAGATCQFHNPRDIKQEPDAVNRLVSIAKTGGLMSRVKEAQSLVAFMIFANQIDKAMTSIKSQCGDGEVRCLQLLYSQLTVSYRFREPIPAPPTAALSKDVSAMSEDEMAQVLCVLIKERDDLYSKDKAACEKTRRRIRAIGEFLGKNGGSARMQRVAYRVQEIGAAYRARVRDLEMEWEGICGWQS